VGELLHFSQKIESDDGATPGLSNLFIQLVASVQKLQETAHAIDELHARLPDGPFKSQLELCRLDMIGCINEAKVRIERLAASAQPSAGC
jgi:hypothetical protein